MRLAQLHSLRAAIAAIIATAFTAIVLAPGVADDAGAPQSANASGEFERKRYDIRGTWEIVVRDDGVRVLRFSDDFRTRNGPDLKVFLSPTAFADVDGASATAGSLTLGALQSNRGAQDYVIPTDADLSAYASVLVHCEEFSVLWGGGALAD